MDGQYARQYRDLYRRHWWWRAREELVLATLRRSDVRPSGNVLDVGCGDGLFFDRLAEFGAVEGVEPDRSIVTDEGHSRGTIHVRAFDESFRPGKSYSLIVMLDVLEHLPDPEAALRLALALLEPDGVLLVTVPAFLALWTTHDDLNRHYTRYTRASFQHVARAAGVRVDLCRYFYHWLFPVKLAVRFKERLLGSGPSSPQVPPAPINSVCHALSRLEHALCRRMSLPVGSSLLAVGKRWDGSIAPGRPEVQSR